MGGVKNKKELMKEKKAKQNDIDSMNAEINKMNEQCGRLTVSMNRLYLILENHYGENAGDEIIDSIYDETKWVGSTWNEFDLAKDEEVRNSITKVAADISNAYGKIKEKKKELEGKIDEGNIKVCQMENKLSSIEKKLK